MLQYSFVWYLSPVVFTGSPTWGNPKMLARGSILVCMDEDKKSEGRFEVRRKRSTVDIDNYEMEEEDFIKTMRQALSVPPMPRTVGIKQEERVGEE